MTALSSLLQRYREQSTSERDKGDSLERLIQFYLKNDPKYDFENVWLWRDWAENEGLDKRDTGIDLVAKERETEIIWAIQSKFYAEDARLYKRHIDSFFAESGKKPFGHRLLVVTTSEVSEHVQKTIEGQQIPCSTLTPTDLEESSLDWSKYEPDGKAEFRPRKTLFPHQQMALERTLEGLKDADRGKLLMACGSGKTFTALKVAEKMVGKGGRVLFLVPSISLLSQAVGEWAADAEVPLHAFAVCSDSTAGKRKKSDNEDMLVSDLAYPATTNAEKLAEKLAIDRPDQMTVVFSTYQSINVSSEAQKKYGVGEFDLIFCDEAHRTTGATLSGEERSLFVSVHEQEYIRTKKRIYMTATPRIFSDTVKDAASEAEATLCSMDDETKFGKTLYTINFSECVQRGLLSDYKVVVLAVDEAHVSKSVQKLLTQEGSELKLDDASKIIGCWKALSKQGLQEEWLDAADDMRRAVAFCKDIKTSKRIADFFPLVVDEYLRQEENAEIEPLCCKAKHVDGSDPSVVRKSLLRWLASDPRENDTGCHILSNARCLTEGVDVPALDAILFLNPRRSQIDIVQAVGRVMRKSAGKERGYVILPIGIPAGVSPQEALNDNKRYKVVWQVLQALRSHDDTFDAMINKIDLDVDVTSKMEVVAVTRDLKRKTEKEKEILGDGSHADDTDLDGTAEVPKAPEQMSLPLGDLEKAIYAKIVKRCGKRTYWEEWAGDIAKIAQNHITRITAAISKGESKERKAFDAFLEEIRDDLNDSISESEAIEMLAQHLITKPVFDALFEGYEFAKNNPVSQAMQHILGILGAHNLENEAESLDKFYASVRMRAKGIEKAQAKQKIITELYDKFFRNAFPKMTEKLGIVYTPVEVVDFIIHSVNDVLKAEFGETLGSKGVHIVDPFTGTGTFITRLLESGLISREELPNKYANEIHANEIVLLAYYIAAINIEATYHTLTGEEYQPFEGICLTDTFQLYEKEDAIADFFEDNTQRRVRQKELDIRVILGNPPYSAGQKSANDNAANVSYPSLDESIRQTYAANTDSTNVNSLYDSYIRAIRWASDRIGDSGVVAYVTNAGWIDGNAMDGLRKCLVEEFSSLYVFHLRGNARTSGEQRRKEKDNVFGQGTRTPVAISLFVKNPSAKENGRIYFHDIGDYLSREQKLTKVRDFGSIDGISSLKLWGRIQPDKHNDWLEQRDDSFTKFMTLGSKKSNPECSLFSSYSRGLETGRDAWVYNCSQSLLLTNVEKTIRFYSAEIRRLSDKQNPPSKLADFVVQDSTSISWSSSLLTSLSRRAPLSLNKKQTIVSVYRPFFKELVYYDQHLNHRLGQMPRIFPNGEAENLVIAVTGIGSNKPFSAFMCDTLPDLEVISKSQCFPLRLYEATSRKSQGDLFDEAQISPSTTQDGITDDALKHFKNAYLEEDLSKDDIFYYIYGLLHSEGYRTRFEANLSKELPRIPCVKSAKDFWAFVRAGRELGELHVGYESVTPYPVKFKDSIDVTSLSEADLRVEKMKFGGKGREKDKTTVKYNHKITMTDIPLEAYDYVVNGKPALEWVMERQAVTTDKKSGIVNDANCYAIETVGDPAYPLRLFQRVITVSLETMKIVKELPPLDI